MHPEAHEGFGRMLAAAGVDPAAPMAVLDLGGQYINGSVHDWLTASLPVTLDLENADIVADAARWAPDREYDLVVSTELFEHTPDWRLVLGTAHAALRPGGRFVATCASDDRPPHGATGGAMAQGEWYRNVPPGELVAGLRALFRRFGLEYRHPPGDAYMWGAK